MEENKQIALTSVDSELVLDEAPASVAMLIGGDSEKAGRIAEHRLQMASIRKQYPHPSHPYILFYSALYCFPVVHQEDGSVIKILVCIDV